MNEKEFTPATTLPKRQGFYEVELSTGKTCIADYREVEKAQGKVWWQFVSDDPTSVKVPELLLGVSGWRNAEKSAIAAALARLPTVAEQIEAAFKIHMSNFDLYDQNLLAPPANRQLQVGDALELGNLKDCKVIETRDEGSHVILSYRSVRQVYGETVDSGTQYRAVHWTDVVPTAQNQATKLVCDTLMYDGYRTSALDSLLSRYQRGLDDNPSYQRGYVWTPEDKHNLLDSLCNGREIGRFIFVAKPYPQRDEILDGKQRLTCLWEFFTSQLSYKGLYWHELSPRDRNRIEARSVQYADLPAQRYTPANLMQIFLELNAAGVPQTEAHLQKVRELLAQELAKEVK